MSEDGKGQPNPPAVLDVHPLDLEFWPNLDIGNEFLHVDWLEDARKPEGQPDLQHAQLGRRDGRLDDAIAVLEGIGDGLDAVGDGNGPLLGIDGILEGIEDDLDFLQTQRPTTETGMSAPQSAIQSLKGKDPTSIKGKGPKKKHQTDRQANRLRWTPELHALFVEAVQHLKGPEKATPKGIMLYMKVEGLTTFHIKSHLQKYRMNCSLTKDEAKRIAYGAEVAAIAEVQGTNCTQQEAASSSKKKQKKAGKAASIAPHVSPAAHDTEGGSHDRRIEHALMVQMQMQKKLQEQLEEQRKLQLSIQAQEQHIRRLKEELQRSKADDDRG